MKTIALFLAVSVPFSLGTPAPTRAPKRRPPPCFSSKGGPGGDFDWVIESGQTFLLDTGGTAIVGGPNGAGTSVQTVSDGVVLVRDLIVEEGAELRAKGPFPLRILASRDVIVRGRIDVGGFSARDVATVNQGDVVELGGAGGPGGGRGGDGNPPSLLPSGQPPRGGDGTGPVAVPPPGLHGGEGGSAHPSFGKDARRPGGGAGGRFARDQGPGLEAQRGANGSPLSIGAETSQRPSLGGFTNPGPFLDGDPRNDFFGLAPVLGAGGTVLDKREGELPGLWAGHGGGGGGNAMPVFPNPAWTPASDEKGAGGGGGGGGLHVQALGRIVFGLDGEIQSDGGRGGTGENVIGLDHVGGSGGSGSGGHVVLESATFIDFTDGGANVGAAPRDWLSARGGARVTGFAGGLSPDVAGYSNGGAGGPGVVQLHVPDPTLALGTSPALAQIVVPASVAAQRDPLDAVASPRALALYLTCEPRRAAPRARR